MAECDAALIATPSSELREVLGRVRASRFEQPVIWACKGFEQASGKLPHQVAAEVLGKRAACGALSGPSFAWEMARGVGSVWSGRRVFWKRQFSERIRNRVLNPGCTLHALSVEVVATQLVVLRGKFPEPLAKQFSFL